MKSVYLDLHTIWLISSKFFRIQILDKTKLLDDLHIVNSLKMMLKHILYDNLLN